MSVVTKFLGLETIDWEDFAGKVKGFTLSKNTVKDNGKHVSSIDSSTIVF